MHLQELPEEQRAFLNTNGLPAITARVLFSAYMKQQEGLPNADGSLNFSEAFSLQTIDLSELILNSEIRVKNAIPVLPTGSGNSNQEGEVSLQVTNQRGYFSGLQNGAALSFNRVLEAEVNISALCGDMPPLPLYAGAPYQPFTEDQTSTIIHLRNTLWDIINADVVPAYVPETDFGINSQNQSPETVFKRRYNITQAGEFSTFYSPINCFDSFGRIVTNVENSNLEKLRLNKISFKISDEGERPPLGNYELLIVTNDSFRLTQPDGKFFEGTFYQDFVSDFVTIAAADWVVIDTEDIEETTISFNTFFTASGNPVSIVKQLLASAVTNNWENLDNTVTQIDWDQLNRLELMFNNTRVYVSETNSSNEVFSITSETKPLRVRALCQKILSHIGCQLTVRADGKITVTSQWVLDGVKQVATYTEGVILEEYPHRIIPKGPLYNSMTVRYGLSSLDQEYRSTIQESIPGQVSYNNIAIDFPYFKSGINRLDAIWATKKLFGIATSVNIELNLECFLLGACLCFLETLSKQV